MWSKHETWTWYRYLLWHGELQEDILLLKLSFHQEGKCNNVCKLSGTLLINGRFYHLAPAPPLFPPPHHPPALVKNSFKCYLTQNGLRKKRDYRGQIATKLRVSLYLVLAGNGKSNHMMRARPIISHSYPLHTCHLSYTFTLSLFRVRFFLYSGKKCFQWLQAYTRNHVK